MAVATGTKAARTPIRMSPPAIPNTPDMAAVIRVAARMTAMTGEAMEPNRTNQNENAH